MMKSFSLFFGLLGLVTFLPAAEKPNIVVIMADDLGWGDASCYGANSIKTPAIDQLAAEGLRFTSGYCSASTCTPTRYSLLTGNYAFRTKNTGIAPPNGPAIIDPGTPTMASLVKQSGYRTAVIGKWHLGLGETRPDWNGELKPGPLEIGFDHCLLLPTTNDRVPQVFVENHRVRHLDPADPLWVGDRKPSPDHPTGITDRAGLKLDWSHGHNDTIHNGISRIGFYTGGKKARYRDEDLADEWIKESRQWISSQKNQPFLLFFAAHDIHVPRMPHERFQGKSGMGLRGDSILQFDWCVGELMKIVEQNHLSENTLFVLCSDNGPVLDDGYQDQAVEKLGSHQPAGPYRGGKYSVFEGGTRTPFITRWKGRITPGVSDQIVCTIDLPASFAALVQTTIPSGGCTDSQNLLPALLGEKNAKGRDILLQQDNNGAKFGLRMGRWKLVREKNKAQMNHQLFDLEKDPAEKQNLAAQYPEERKRMVEKLNAIIAVPSR
ncbi:MAG: sulfatase family protein [Akkermansiaceae bacterium]|jgi:arylsulfatase A